MGENKSNQQDKDARAALEAWIRNINLWCHDAQKTGWQNAQK